MAKAQAQVYKAIENAEALLKQENQLSITINFPMSKIVKIFNLIDEDQKRYFKKQNYDEIFNDIVEESNKITSVIYAQIVTPKRTGFGAYLGDIFIELANSSEAMKLIENLNVKKYEGKDISIVCVPIASYVGYYLNLMRNDF